MFWRAGKQFQVISLIRIKGAAAVQRNLIVSWDSGGYRMGPMNNKEMTSEQFSQLAATIPTDPGIYKYFDEKDELVYVGKAKNLRKRVSSYFTKTFTTYKTHELVQRIRRIEFTIVGSEQDAFLLENSLIKQFQPKFNINLKDDKSYPYIVIKNEPFPRVFLTRRKISDGSEYLGPYTSVGQGARIAGPCQSQYPAAHLSAQPLGSSNPEREI